MKKKKGLIFILLIIIAIGIGVGAYFLTSSKDSKKADSKPTVSKATTEKNNEEQPANEEVTYLEFPDKSDEEKQILERYSNNNDYKVIPISRKQIQGIFNSSL